MEDLDALAGAISYKHADDGLQDSSPLTIVTASVDRIDFLKPFGVSDLRLSGHVTYVGFSSMEGENGNRYDVRLILETNLLSASYRTSFSY
jgi:acyl-CoA hydrolase